MKKSIILIAALAFVLAALPATAGVIITQTERATSSADTLTIEKEKITMIQGNKQKEIVEEHSTKTVAGSQQAITEHIVLISDLDNDKTYILMPDKKWYFQSSSPFPGKTEDWMQFLTSNLKGAGFSSKSASTTRMIVGYKCANYEFDGQMFGNHFTGETCLSAEAPGNKEFTAFRKKMRETPAFQKLREKFKGETKITGEGAPSGKLPQGIPLAMDATFKMTGLPSLPGMNPELAAKIEERMANGITGTMHMVVTKIEVKDLADDVFKVPAGYIEQGMPGLSEMLKCCGANPTATASASPTESADSKPTPAMPGLTHPTPAALPTLLP
jgi:hypothetical protein